MTLSACQPTARQAAWDGGRLDAVICGAHDLPPVGYQSVIATANAALVVCGDLAAEQALVSDGDVAVARDVRTTAPVSIAGTLYVGRRARGVRAVSAEIDCDAAPDVYGWVERATDNRDRAADGALAWSGEVHAAAQILLGCGRYVTERLQVDAPLEVEVTAPTVWVVRGDVRLAAPLRVHLADGASLEWVIGGDVVASETLEVGDEQHPVLLAIAGDLRVTAHARMYGDLLMPAGRAWLRGAVEVYGRAFLGDTRVAAPFGVFHLDKRAVTLL